MISIIDYGLGNILAFSNIYSRLNIPITVARSNSDLKEATKLILPGVGSFDHAIQLLEKSGMKNTINEMVIDKEIPILGICVGMQILAQSSEEGNLPGLGWIEGSVKKFQFNNTLGAYLPHMGWNDVKSRETGSLFKNLEAESRFYFLHSFYFECADSENILATTEYFGEFTCAVRKNNIFGVQFHPEKSHHFGSQLLKNFAEI